MSGPPLREILDVLERRYGEQVSQGPLDPYLFLVWWHCGYPASDERCLKGWQSLNGKVGVEPDRLLSASNSALIRALKPGGMVPALRAKRLKLIAQRVQRVFDGDVVSTLRGLSLAHARTTLKSFPGIGDPGADRILLFGGLHAIAAVPSNCPHVLVRILSGNEPVAYANSYSEAQQLLETELPATFAARMRAYLLLKRHGQELCKRTKPRCAVCPLASCCTYFACNGAIEHSSAQ